MKKLLYLLPLIPSLLWADAKVSILQNDLTPTNTDFMYIVANSTSMKVGIGNLLNVGSTNYLPVSSSATFNTSLLQLSTYTALISSIQASNVQNQLQYVTLTVAGTSYLVKADSATFNQFLLQRSSFSAIPPGNISAGSLGASVLASSVAASSFQAAITPGANVTIANTGNGVSISATSSGGGGGGAMTVTASSVVLSQAISTINFTSDMNVSVVGGTVSVSVDPNVYLLKSSAAASNVQNQLQYLTTTVGATSYFALGSSNTVLTTVTAATTYATITNDNLKLLISSAQASNVQNQLQYVTNTVGTTSYFALGSSNTVLTTITAATTYATVPNALTYSSAAVTYLSRSSAPLSINLGNTVTGTLPIANLTTNASSYWNYPSTGSFVTSTGLVASTITINNGTALGITAGASRARFRMGGILSLQNVNTDVADSAGVFIAAASSGTGAPAFYTMRRASGSTSVPIATSTGQILGQMSAGGYGATNWAASSTGRIDFVADETFTDASQATSLNLYTTPTGSITNTLRTRIDSSGAITDYSSHTFTGTVVISSGLIASGSAGINGQVLTSGGANAIPTWTTVSGGGGGGGSMAVALSSVVLSQSISTVNYSSDMNISVVGGTVSVSAAPYLFNTTFNPDQARSTSTTAACQIDNSTSYYVSQLRCDDTANEDGEWSTILSPYRGRTLNADITYSMTSAVSGNVVDIAQVYCSTAGVVVDTTTWNAGNTSTIAVPSVAGSLQTATIALSSPGGSCVQGAVIVIRFSRQGSSASDTASGDQAVRKIRIYE